MPTDDDSPYPKAGPVGTSPDYPISEADETLALRLVGWIFADGPRAERLLGLTGLEPEALRAGLSDPAVLGALMDFVINHEPDLLACADALGVSPAALSAAHGRIAR